MGTSSALLYVNTEIPKNHYHETFLVYISLTLLYI